MNYQSGPMAGADKFTLMDQKTVSGPFGPEKTWTDGAEFDCLFTLDSSMEARSAEQLGVKSLFTGQCDKNIPIDYHSVFRRVSDGATFRVTSHPQDNKAPDVASMPNMAFTAERYDLPSA